MAAYAALVSLMHLIDQIQHHPRPPISLDKQQVESLTQNIIFLQDFLEDYSHIENKEADDLGSRMADAAYGAEDVIESQIVDLIHVRSTSHWKIKSSIKNIGIKIKKIMSSIGFTSHGEEMSSTSHGEEISSMDFYQRLQKVIQEMDAIKKEVVEIKEKTGIQDQPHKSTIPTASLRSSSTRQNNTMVGFDNMLLEIMDKLTGQQSSRQIFPIVGMGGMGKTTLAQNIYMQPLIVKHFDICAWVTISQQYNATEILREVLRQVNTEVRGDSSENELGVQLHKYLIGRRYLIVLDDMWSIEVWDEIKNFFPDYNNGSRIVVTTRLSCLAFQLTGSHVFVMEFLDESESWNLFCRTVFGKKNCPLELGEVGKKISKSCKGLPLSIVVIGGLLKKSEHIPKYWEFVAENLNSIVNSKDSEHCLKILKMSYHQLPVYLRPCFLYMGVFQEDHIIRVSMLIKLWVAEGFLKPISGKSLDEVAEGYFKELIDRNLILVHTIGSTGKIKCCNIHDLLRDFCLREAQKDRFLYVLRQHSLNIPHDINIQRRIASHRRISKKKVHDALGSTSLVRSLICNSECALKPYIFRLLRICNMFDEKSTYASSFPLNDIFRLVNSRYIAIRVDNHQVPSSIYLLWNLHTLVVNNDLEDLTAPPEIWKMPQLRHVKFKGLRLPKPPSGQIDGRDDFVLENLHTLSNIINFKCSKKVVKIIPNIKKLRIFYERKGSSPCSLHNLHHLNKLESFLCDSSELCNRSEFVLLQNLTFPHSLKKLTLKAGFAHWEGIVPHSPIKLVFEARYAYGDNMTRHLLKKSTHEARCTHWEDILEKISSLPRLEKLKLIGGSFGRDEWATVEDQFCSLKFLLIEGCDLKYWNTDSIHFPCLEHLVLECTRDLEEIPSCIGDIPTLQSIKLIHCSDSAVISAKKLLEEQEELENNGLQIEVVLGAKDEALESLTCRNFRIEIESSQLLDVLEKKSKLWQPVKQVIQAPPPSPEIFDFLPPPPRRQNPASPPQLRRASGEAHACL